MVNINHSPKPINYKSCCQHNSIAFQRISGGLVSGSRFPTNSLESFQRNPGGRIPKACEGHQSTLMCIYKMATMRMLTIDIDEQMWYPVQEADFQEKLEIANYILETVSLEKREKWNMKNTSLAFTFGKNNSCNRDFYVLSEMMKHF